MRIRAVFLLVFIGSLPDAFACKLVDLTAQSASKRRTELIANENMPGIRVGILGMKEANGLHGLGKVNESLAAYEKSLCQRFKGADAPKVSVFKTDFKGYYLTCSPMPSCAEAVSQTLVQMPGPALDGGPQLKASQVKAQNYSEGYIKSRAVAAYDNFKEPLDNFLQKELKEAVLEATGETDLRKLKPNDPVFLEELSKNIDEYRKNGEAGMDAKFKRLVRALDNLMETPFVASNNIDKELEDALNGKRAAKVSGGLQVSSAQTGDDLFIVIREGDEVVKVVGADARGLGATNMSARYRELAASFAKGEGVDGIADVKNISKRAIVLADESMDKSLGLYKQLALEELSRQDLSDGIDEAVARAHHRYNEIARIDPELVAVRAGAINDCGTDTGEVMNRITATHNRLKVLEAAGIDGVFGASCLGVEYLLLKHGLRK